MFWILSNLTLSWRRPISYRNQSIDLLCKSMDWFLYDTGLRHERVKFCSANVAGDSECDLRHVPNERQYFNQKIKWDQILFILLSYVHNLYGQSFFFCKKGFLYKNKCNNKIILGMRSVYYHLFIKNWTRNWFFINHISLLWPVPYHPYKLFVISDVLNFPSLLPFDSLYCHIRVNHA